MSFGLPLDDPVWSYLYEGRVRKSKPPELPPYLWPWLQQVYTLPKDNADLTDALAPVFRFELRNGDYWISLRPSHNFPNDPPIHKCAFQLAFSLEWHSNDAECCLTSVVQDYKKYCEEVDECVGFIRDIENVAGCSLLGYNLNEDNIEYFDVKLKLESEDQSHMVELTIDWRNPKDFPNTLSLGTFAKTREIECSDWDSSLSLADNLANVFKLGFPSTNQSDLHSIPCNIEYTGPADIDGYFMVEKQNDTSKASFRGHGLEGKNVPMPPGYNLFVLKQNARSATSSTQTFDIISKRSELMLWEWDKEPGPRSTMVRALEFLPLAQRLSSD